MVRFSLCCISRPQGGEGTTIVTCHHILYSRNNNRTRNSNKQIDSTGKSSTRNIRSNAKTNDKNVTSNLTLIRTEQRPFFSGPCNSLTDTSVSEDDKDRKDKIIYDSISRYINSYVSSTSNEFQDTVIKTLTSIITANTEYILDIQNPAKDDIVVSKQLPVILPRKSSEYDRKVLTKILARRRNAIFVDDASTFKEVLSLYMALNNNLWLVEILTSGKSSSV